VKRRHLHVVLQELKCRAKDRREHEVRRTGRPLRRSNNMVTETKKNLNVRSGLLELKIV
jgi:hypothetical protein